MIKETPNYLYRQYQRREKEKKMALTVFKDGKINTKEVNKGSNYCPLCHKEIKRTGESNLSQDGYYEEAYCANCNRTLTIVYRLIWESSTIETDDDNKTVDDWANSK